MCTELVDTPCGLDEAVLPGRLDAESGEVDRVAQGCVFATKVVYFLPFAPMDLRCGFLAEFHFCCGRGAGHRSGRGRVLWM
jgi:hypothetical protein